MAAQKNFSYSTVAVAPSPAASGTTLTVSAGQGALFAVGRMAVVYPTGVAPLSSNSEIVLVSNVVGDVLTIDREEESTTARTIVVGDQIAQIFTAGQLNTLEADIAAAGSVATDSIWDAEGDLVQGTGPDTAARLPIGTAGQVLSVNAGADAVEWKTVAGTGDVTAAAALTDMAVIVASGGAKGVAASTLTAAFVKLTAGVPAATTAVADTSGVGLAPQATAPAAGLLSVLAIANGETVRTDKAIFDTTNPAALGSVGPGTAVVAARRDHVHAMPSAAAVGAAAATSFIAGAGALTGPASPLTIGTAAASAVGDFATAAKFIAGAGALTGPASPLTIGTAAASAVGDFQPAAAALSSAQAQATASIRALGTGNPEPLGTAGAGNATTASPSNHVHANPALDTLAAATDITTLNASTTAHGLALKVTAPASGMRNVHCVDNTETARKDAALFDATVPADIGTAAAGSSLSAARRDHVHAIPAAHVTTLMMQNGGSIQCAILTSIWA